MNAPSPRDVWLAERRKGIGSSDAAAILGVDSFRCALDVARDKMGLVETSPEVESWRHARGHALEAAIAEWYEIQTGDYVRDFGAYAIDWHPTIDYLFCTVDRHIMRNGQAGILEIKAWVRDHWPEGPPLSVQVQCQHQMAVTGLPWVRVVADLGREDLCVYEVNRHDEFIQKRLLPDLERFWQIVQSGELPEPDGSGAATRTLQRLFSPVNGRTVALPAHLCKVDEQLVAAKSRLKELEEAKRWCENRIRYSIGEHEAGVLPNGVKYTWKPDKNGKRMLLRKEPRNG